MNGVLPLPWERAGERVGRAPHPLLRVSSGMPRHSRLSTLRTNRGARFARSLRSNMPDAEARLWYYLRASRFDGWKFRRQVPIGSFVVDFLCEQARLIVEIDGGQHAERTEADAIRTQWLREQGYDVLRYWNNEVMTNIEGVLATLSLALSQGRGKTATLSPALPQGGGRTAKP